MKKKGYQTMQLQESNELDNNQIWVCDGFSPSHVASILGVSRQRVYQLVNKGKLSGTKIIDKHGEVIAVMISADSIRKLKNERQLN